MPSGKYGDQRSGKDEGDQMPSVKDEGDQRCPLVRMKDEGDQRCLLVMMKEIRVALW